MDNIFTYSVEIEGKDRILRINAQSYNKFASIEDDPNVMSYVLMKLIENPNIDTIEIIQEETISYYKDSINLLYELATVYVNMKEVIRNYYNYLAQSTPFFHEYKKVIEWLDKEFLYDPIGVYVSIKRLKRKIEAISGKNEDVKSYALPLLQLIEYFLSEFEKTKVYHYIKDFLYGYRVGDRDIYKRLFMGDIKPNFLLIKYLSKIEEDAEVIETYKLDKYTEVFILKRPEEIFFRYYIFPEEYKMFPNEILLINKIRDILLQYQPKREDFLDIDRLREVYDKIISNLVLRYQSTYGLNISKDRYDIIKSIIIRYSIGFGILEKLALDENIQDIFVNPPAGRVPISVQHAKYDLCITNVIPTKRELESWATKLRLISGRPFDEANPVLDTELLLEKVSLRVAGITHPLSPDGLSFVFRRHRERPWTLPLFIDNKMINPLAAAVLSFLVANGRTILIAGTRGSGKTSLLTALMLEIPRKVRIITVEDTLEIPVSYFKKLGYDIVSLKVRSPFSIQSTEMRAEDGLRVSLRLGDSAIIVGEVRSKEAQTLYEAMRVGALANAVMGTIHAESPFGVYDRVVNDLGVPPASFKATDIIVIANPIKDPSGIRKYRRVIRITEVRKMWEKDPLKEKAFVDLFVYDADKDELYPTPNLLHGDSDVLKSVASRIKYLSKSWENIWKMIEILAETKKTLVEYSKATGNREILEADFVVLSNEIVYKLIEESIEKYEDLNKEEILEKYKKWLKEKV